MNRTAGGPSTEELPKFKRLDEEQQESRLASLSEAPTKKSARKHESAIDLLPDRAPDTNAITRKVIMRASP